MGKKTRGTRRKSRGAVLLIVSLLMGSALVRLSSGTGQVSAQAVTQEDDTERAVASGDDQTSDHTSPVAPLNRPHVAALLEALQAREKRVKELEMKIELRSKALAIADTEITRRLEVLEQAEETLRSTLSLANGAAEEDLTRLTAVYESMKPKDTAALFATMEPNFAAGFIGRMQPDVAAAVMTGLPPDVAYSISVILAGRNAGVPKS